MQSAWQQGVVALGLFAGVAFRKGHWFPAAHEAGVARAIDVVARAIDDGPTCDGDACGGAG